MLMNTLAPLASAVFTSHLRGFGALDSDCFKAVSAPAGRAHHDERDASAGAASSAVATGHDGVDYAKVALSVGLRVLG